MGDIEAIRYMENLAYLLNDEALFFGTGYKVLQSQSEDDFISCARSRHNGRIKLVFFTEGYRSLSDCSQSMDAPALHAIIADLVKTINRVKQNGFLVIQNIDLDPDRIYVDAATLKTRIIYLPISKPVSGANINEFYEYFRNMIADILMTCPHQDPATVELKAFLAEKTYDYQTFINYFYGMRVEAGLGIKESGNVPVESRVSQAPSQSNETKIYYLHSENHSVPLVFRIENYETIIGKSSTKSDCVIEANPAVSRAHCKLTISDGELFVTDLNSSNGTFVNEMRLASGRSQKLPVGSRLRLANVGFSVTAGEGGTHG